MVAVTRALRDMGQCLRQVSISHRMQAALEPAA